MEYCKPVVLTWNEVNKGNFHAEGDSKLLLLLRVSANLKKNAIQSQGCIYANYYSTILFWITDIMSWSVLDIQGGEKGDQTLSP
jgi:hypothetical protein